MTGTFASRAFFTSAAIFGTDATQVGRGGQMTEVMSSTRRAAPFTGTSTATGSGIFGIGDVGDGAKVGAGLAGAALVAAAAWVGVGAAAGVEHEASSAVAAIAGMTLRITRSMGSSSSEAGELPLPHDRIEQRRPSFLPDHVDGAPERGADLLRIGDRTLAVPAEGFREHREVRRGVRQVHTDV